MTRLQLSKAEKANAKRGIAVVRGAIRNGMLPQPFTQRELERMDQKFNEKGRYKHTLEFMRGRNEILCKNQRYELNAKYSSDGLIIAEQVLQKNTNAALQHLVPSITVQKQIPKPESVMTNAKASKGRIKEFDRLCGLYTETSGRLIIGKSEWQKSSFLPASKLQFLHLAAKRGWFKNLGDGRWEWLLNPLTGKPLTNVITMPPMPTNEIPGIEVAAAEIHRTMVIGDTTQAALEVIEKIKAQEEVLAAQLHDLTKQRNELEAGIRKQLVTIAIEAFRKLSIEGMRDFSLHLTDEEMKELSQRFKQTSHPPSETT